MNFWHWLLIGELALSGLVVFGRGCAGSTRHYTVYDAIAGLVEMGFFIWIVAVKL